MEGGKASTQTQRHSSGAVRPIVLLLLVVAVSLVAVLFMATRVSPGCRPLLKAGTSLQLHLALDSTEELSVPSQVIDMLQLYICSVPTRPRPLRDGRSAPRRPPLAGLRRPLLPQPLPRLALPPAVAPQPVIAPRLAPSTLRVPPLALRAWHTGVLARRRPPARGHGWACASGIKQYQLRPRVQLHHLDPHRGAR